ncbi:MAG: flavin reductase family protein [Tunicatimonas sp.]|uniref:flavin reductase family protein n=1 Tax=Tunicatimonas sp. TaxID=1940096 RepID=UPI003C78DBB7
MKVIRPSEVSTQDFYQYMIGAVVPRPIAFVSSISSESKVNLSPYSFFNAVSSKPPVLIFSPVNSVRDGSTKNTLDNVREHPEVTINIVNYALVEQMSLTSTAYEKGINEFAKAGLTEVPSETVKPPRVAESPVAFECQVKQVMPLGEGGGAGNLVICEVLLVHVNEEILGEDGAINPFQLDAVGRMGGSAYCRASGDALFETLRPVREKGIGVDQLPEDIRTSTVLSGSDLAQLANVSEIPNQDLVQHYRHESTIQAALVRYEQDAVQSPEIMHWAAKNYLSRGEVEKAWAALLSLQ